MYDVHFFWWHFRSNLTILVNMSWAKKLVFILVNFILNILSYQADKRAVDMTGYLTFLSATVQLKYTFSLVYEIVIFRLLNIVKNYKNWWKASTSLCSWIDWTLYSRISLGSKRGVFIRFILLSLIYYVTKWLDTAPLQKIIGSLIKRDDHSLKYGLIGTLRGTVTR
jgi:hypothetical protein